jgi:hypothetical protein
MNLKYNEQQTIVIGPAIDNTDGVTAITDISKTDHNYDCTIALFKNGVRSTITATDNGTNLLTHLADGYYSLVLETGNVNTVGRLKIAINHTTFLSIFHDFEVLPQQVFNSFIAGSDLLDVTPDDTSTITSAISTTESNIRGTDDDTLKTLSEQLDAVDTSNCDYSVSQLKTDIIDVVTGVETNILDSITTSEENVRGTDDDTLKTISDQLDDLDIDLTDAINITVTPVQTTVIQPVDAENNVVLFQHSAGTDLSFVCTDANDDDIDLSAGTVVLHVWNAESDATLLYKTTDDDITISGSPVESTAVVSYSTTDTATEFDGKYDLWLDVSEDNRILLAYGKFCVKHAVFTQSSP